MTNRHVTPLVPTALLLVVGLLAAAPLHAQGPPSAVEYYHLGALGSVRVVTNQSGAVVSRHDLMPFGEEWQPVTLGREALLFTGKERDYDTGLDYFGARYYRAGLGRFTTVDPVETTPENVIDPQRWNRYSYVRHSPLRYVDPDGRYTTDCATGDAACHQQAMKFEEARQKNLKRRSTRNAAEAYGKPGDDNGVHVHFNVPEQGGYDDGVVDASGSAPMKPDIHVWIKASVQGAEYERLVAHEGSPVSDAMRFVMSGFDQRFNYTYFETEFRAFAVGASVMPYERKTVCGTGPCSFSFGPRDASTIRRYLRTAPRYAVIAHRYVFPRR